MRMSAKIDYARIWELSREILKKDGTPNASEIGRIVGTTKDTVIRTLSRPELDYRNPELYDSEVLAAAKAGGIEDPRNLSHFWKIMKDQDGNGYSLFVKNPHNGQNMSVYDMVREAVAYAAPDLPRRDFPARTTAKGSQLLVLDLADVHFLKLSVKTETGYEYNRQVARHRMIEGTKELLKQVSGLNIGHILFVLGNDILHIDNPRSTTTNGTFQNVDGTIFQGYLDASAALEEAVLEAAEVAPVDLLHCMSNHDWVTGFGLSQTVAARTMMKSKRVRATPYNMSEAHYKYFRFGSNLLGFTHGNGAKEEKLYGLMVKDAREHISECKNLYWYLHHVHHKVRKTRGEIEYLKEKDHNGMTAIVAGGPRIEGEQINIEYVRSPSAPDSWHSINGYVNLQAVECFVHHPEYGQKARFTEYF